MTNTFYRVWNRSGIGRSRRFPSEAKAVEFASRLATQFPAQEFYVMAAVLRVSRNVEPVKTERLNGGGESEKYAEQRTDGQQYWYIRK